MTANSKLEKAARRPPPPCPATAARTATSLTADQLPKRTDLRHADSLPTGRSNTTQGPGFSAYNSSVDDDKLYLPLPAGDSLTRLMYRVGGISDSGTAKITPGWDWEVIMYGLAEAIIRYRSGLGNSKGIEARAAVGEALWWIAAADEFLRKKVSAGLRQAEFYNEIKKTSAGRRFGGLVFLRNRTGHQFAVALMQAVRGSTTVNIRVEDGSLIPNTISAETYCHMQPFCGSAEEGYYFASPDLLPPADTGFEERYHRDEWYGELVAECPVFDILDTVNRSLNKAISMQRSERSMHFAFDLQGRLPAA